MFNRISAGLAYAHTFVLGRSLSHLRLGFRVAMLYLRMSVVHNN